MITLRPRGPPVATRALRHGFRRAQPTPLGAAPRRGERASSASRATCRPTRRCSPPTTGARTACTATGSGSACAPAPAPCSSAEVEGAFAGAGRVAWLEPEGDRPPPPGYYLVGLIVDPAHRRAGVGEALTRARVAWTLERADAVWYFANAGNRASLDLHARLGFEEVTRDFEVAGVTFDGGEGVLARATAASVRAAQRAAARELPLVAPDPLADRVVADAVAPPDRREAVAPRSRRRAARTAAARARRRWSWLPGGLDPPRSARARAVALLVEPRHERGAAARAVDRVAARSGSCARSACRASPRSSGRRSAGSRAGCRRRRR